MRPITGFGVLLFLLIAAVYPARAADPPPWGSPESGEVSGDMDGFIEPYLVVNLGSEVTGVLEQVTVERGDFVKEGQVLAVLDSRVERATTELIKTRFEMEANVELRQARLDYAQREKDRTEELYNKGIIPDQDMDEVQTGLAIAQAELKAAREQKTITGLELKQAEAVLDRRSIRSPINGFVVERFLSPGEQVGDQPILKLAQLDPLNVEVIVPVSMIGRIEVDQRAEVRPEDPVRGTYTGKVTIVDRVVDAASGTFGVRIELANRKFALPAGLKCRVRFLK